MWKVIIFTHFLPQKFKSIKIRFVGKIMKFNIGEM